MEDYTHQNGQKDKACHTLTREVGMAVNHLSGESIEGEELGGEVDIPPLFAKFTSPHLPYLEGNYTEAYATCSSYALLESSTRVYVYPPPNAGRTMTQTPAPRKKKDHINERRKREGLSTSPDITRAYLHAGAITPPPFFSNREDFAESFTEAGQNVKNKARPKLISRPIWPAE